MLREEGNTPAPANAAGHANYVDGWHQARLERDYEFHGGDHHAGPD